MPMLMIRVLLVVIAILAALVLVPVLVWDLALASRIGGSECIVYGESAELTGVEPGSVASPDSGGCLAYNCADEVQHVRRVLLSDYERVESSRRRC